MLYSTIFATCLALFSAVDAAPAAKKYGLKVQYQEGTGKFDGVYLSFNTYNNNTEIVALADGGSKKGSATPYTVSGGAIHVTIPPNMVISSGQYSTNTFTFGSTVVFDKGKGTDANVIVDKKGLLAFDPQQGFSCTNACWELCPLEGSQGLTLGNTGSKCTKVFIKAVPL